MASPKRLTTRQGIRLWTIKHAAGSKDWKDVAVPNAAFDWVPFTIQTNGYKFRPDPSFNIQEYANITVNKTYYVDSENGDDGNSGADWDNALETLNEAWSKADVDRIYATGYWTDSECGSISDRDFELIGVGDCMITTDNTADLGSWTSVDNYYWCDLSEYVQDVYDKSDPDILSPEYGTFLSTQSSIADVNSNAGSKYTDWTNRKLYVRTFDDRAPDSDIVTFDSAPFNIAKDNQTIYVENIEPFPSTYWLNSSAAGGLKVYAKNCKFRGLKAYGLDEIILESCTNPLKKVNDIANHNDREGVSQRSIEINCNFVCLSTGGASDQASTTHNTTRILRIEGYYESGGQAIAGSGDYDWNLGIHTYNPQDGYGYHTSGTAWLDRCYVGGELIEAGAGTIYIRKCTITGAQTGDIQTY